MVDWGGAGMMYPLLLGISFPMLGGDEANNVYSSLIKQMGPWAYWRLDESAPAAGDAAVDSSGNKRAGVYSVTLPIDGDALIRNETAGSAVAQYASAPSLSIPDSNPVGVSSSITVPDEFTVNTIRIAVDITHTYIGDLDIYLANGGAEVLFREKSGGGSENIQASYGSDGSVVATYEAPALMAFVGNPANGEWTIRVADAYNGDTGTLNSWEVTLAEASGIETCISKGFYGAYIPVYGAQNTKLSSEVLPVREFEAWVAFSDLSVNQIIFREGSSQYGWGIGIVNGQLCVAVSVGGEVKKASYPVENLVTDAPYHVCGIVDEINDRLKLYISAQLVEEVVPAGLSSHASATGAVLGAAYDEESGQEYNPLTGLTGVAAEFQGYLDEVAIYDRERTKEERELAYLTGDLGVTPALPYDGPRIYNNAAPHLEKKVVVGYDVVYAVDTDNEAHGWGDNEYETPESFRKNGLIVNKAGGMNGGVKAIPFVNSGERHVVLLGDGTPVAWGANKNSAFFSIPVDAVGLTDIAQGIEHVIGLKPDGSVVGWGDDISGTGPMNVPAGLSGVWKIFAAQFVSAAIKNDGSVVVWGRNDYDIQSVPASAVNVTSLAINANTAIALKAGGEVIGWGDDYDGVASPPAGLNASKVFISPMVKSGSVRRATAMAITSAGGVVAWGSNDNQLLNVPAFSGEVVDLALSNNFAMALLADGSIEVWGVTDYGRLSVPAAATTGVVSVSCNQRICVVAKQDGSVVVWGYDAAAMAPPDDLSNVVAAYANDFNGNRVLVKRSDGTLTYWSASSDNGGNDIAFWPWLGVANPMQGWKDAAANYGCVLYLQEDGTLFPVGWLGGMWSSDRNMGSVAVIQRANEVGVELIAHGPSADHTFFYTSAGELVAIGDAYDFEPVPAFTDPVQLATTYEHFAILQENGYVICWGDNSEGQCDVPVEIQGRVVSLSCGEYHTLALLDDGTVRGWGANYSNESTGGDLLTDVVMVAATSYGGIALTDDGQVHSWGSEVDIAGGDWPEANNGDVIAVYESNFYPTALLCGGDLTVYGGLSTMVPEPSPLNITDANYCPLFSSVGLADARLLYNFPVYPDRHNHGTRGSSPNYDLVDTPPDIRPAVDGQGNTSGNPPVLYGYAHGNGFTPVRDILGDGYVYSVLVHFKSDKDGGYNGNIFELGIGSDFNISIRNVISPVRQTNNLIIEHKGAGGAPVDSWTIEDYEYIQGDDFPAYNWARWNGFALVRRFNRVQLYMGRAGIFGCDVYDVEMNSPGASIKGHSINQEVTVKLGGEGINISRAAVFDFALRHSDANSLAMNDQLTIEPA